MVATPTAVVHPSIAEEPAASITLSPPTESELKAEAAEAARAGARAGVVVMSGTLYCRGGRMFSLFRPQSVSLVAERGGHATARAVGSRRRRGSNQRRPSAVPLERQHWLVFGNNNHPVHGDAHCVVVRCADFVKVRVTDESRLEMAISTASGKGGMRIRARTHAEFNQWLSALLGAWRDHEHDELRWAPSRSSGDWTPTSPGERGHEGAPVAPGGTGERGVPAAAAAESAEHKARRERAAAELRKRTWAAFASIDMPVPLSVRHGLNPTSTP